MVRDLNQDQREVYQTAIQMFGQFYPRNGFYWIHAPGKSHPSLSLLTNAGFRIECIFENLADVRRVARELNADYSVTGYFPIIPYIDGMKVIEDSLHLTNHLLVSSPRIDFQVKMFPNVGVYDDGDWWLRSYLFTGRCPKCGARKRVRHYLGGIYQENLSNWPNDNGWIMTCRQCKETFQVGRWQIEDEIDRTRRALAEKYGHKQIVRNKHLRW